MVRRIFLAALVVVGLLTLTAQTAYAWDFITDKYGHGRTTVRSWTRNYNQVAFVADHPGTRVSVFIRVDCQNGDHFDNTWNDGGGRFRYILGGLGNSGRCNQLFRVTPRSVVPQMHLTVLARG